MMRSYEAEIDAKGRIWLLEPINPLGPCRAVVTVLEPLQKESRKEPGDSAELLRFLRGNRLPKEARMSAEEIDAQIVMEKEAWD
ncbi:MAG: hypothetical protein HQL75_10000 [Magnetococcales bacterium]|nr:hypothetical protein [Magnetococcales bacterium]MBF0603794.1 hypothetical protein [Magnetococcales bacterium]